MHRPLEPEPQILMADSRRIRDALDWAPRRSDLDEIIGGGWTARCESPSRLRRRIA